MRQFLTVVECSRLAQFSLVFLAILVLKWPTVVEPPVWDTAMGLFPPALTLAQNGFDLVALFGMPGYEAGGPNAHSASVVTWATAAVWWALGGGWRAIATLHLLQFAATAVGLLALHRLGSAVLGAGTSVLLGIAVLLHPLFSTQVGYLYLEIPLFLFAALSLLAWTRQRFWSAVLWALAAYATKETGVVVAGALGLATLLQPHTFSTKWKRLAILATPLVLWTVTITFLRRIALGSTEFKFLPSFETVFGGASHYLSRFLFNIPDLVGFLLAFIVFATLSLGSIGASLRSGSMNHASRSIDQQAAIVLGCTGLLITCFMLFFLVVLPAATGFTVILPRYYVLVLPFLLLWIGYGIKREVRGNADAAVRTCFVVLSLMFVVNTNGAFYPLDINTEGPGNDPPLTERSNAYRLLLALETDAIRAVEQLPDRVPVYYGHYEHYLFTYPELGYASGPHPAGRNLHTEEPPSLADLSMTSPCLFTLFSYPWLGGEKVLALNRSADQTPGVSAEVVREFRDGRYVITLTRIRREGADCPA